MATRCYFIVLNCRLGLCAKTADTAVCDTVMLVHILKSVAKVLPLETQKHKLGAHSAPKQQPACAVPPLSALCAMHTCSKWLD